MELPQKSTKSKKIVWLIVILLSIGIVFQLVNYQMSRVKVVLYGTSTDSITNQVENILYDLQSKFGSRMKIDVQLVAREKEDGTILSLQSESEEVATYDLEENIRQLVIKKYYPAQFMEYLKVRNADVYNTAWQYFASFAKIDSAKIEAKVKSEGQELLKTASAKFEEIRQALPVNVNSLPLLYINGELYQGSVDHFALSAAIVKPILRGWHSSLPTKTKISLLGDKISFKSWRQFQYNGLSECYNGYDCNDKADKDGICQDVGTATARCIYSQPAEVNLTIVNDEDCPTCSTELAVANLKTAFKNLKINEIEVSSNEGEEIKQAIGIKSLPTYLFDSSVEKAVNFTSYLQAGYLGQLVDNEDYPYALVRSGIPGVLLDREEKENSLDIYVMSHCAYAQSLENALIDLKDDINFDLKVHYVLLNQTDDQGNVSLQAASVNGEAEYNENMRQLVIQKYFVDKFLDYLKERNKDITSEDWQASATAAGLDTAEIEAKVKAEGAELLRNDAQGALDLGINSSPAYLWENKYFGFGVGNLQKFDKFEDLEVRTEDQGYCLNTASQ